LADTTQAVARTSAAERPLPSLPRHHVRLRHRIGTLDVDVDFELTQPWTILFGPSGSGKTTILRAIAGLLRPDFGYIVSTIAPGTTQQQSVTLLDTEAGVYLPAHKRLVRLAPQHPTLFPHLTVLENMKYGMSPLVHDTEEQQHEGILHLHLERFRIANLAAKLPSALSGGEARRVSLARALAGRGSLLMLDEAFSGLDLPLRNELATSLQEWQNDPYTAQILSVTHDVGEAFQIGAEVIQIADGKIVQQGPVQLVLAHQRNQLIDQLNATPETPA
jgi:molybdate transport system ATP-binding protein